MKDSSHAKNLQFEPVENFSISSPAEFILSLSKDSKSKCATSVRDKVLVFAAIVFLIACNTLVIAIQSVHLLLLLAVAVYGFGYFFDSPKNVKKRIKFFLWLFLTLSVFHKILDFGMDLDHIVFLSATTTLQIAVLSQVIFLFAKKTSLSRLLAALAFVPRSARLLATLTFSYISFLVDEQEKVSYAQKSRGYGRTLVSRLASPFSIIVPLVHRIFQRAEAVTMSILSRGYSA